MSQNLYKSQITSMKKLIISLILILFFSNVVSANDKPNYSAISLNDNLIKFDWKIKSKRSTPDRDIYTLKKNKWILVCQIKYSSLNIFTYCALP